MVEVITKYSWLNNIKGDWTNWEVLSTEKPGGKRTPSIAVG